MAKNILHIYDEEEETAYLNESADEGLRKILNGEPGYRQFATMILTPIAVDIREQIARSAIEKAINERGLDGLTGNHQKCLHQLLPDLMNRRTYEEAKDDFEEKIQNEAGRDEVRKKIIGEALPRACQHVVKILHTMNQSADSLIKIREKEVDNG